MLERDKDEHWNRAEGHFATIHAGYTDVWASKSDKTMYRTKLDELNETNSHWLSQPGPSGSTLLALDIGLEEVWYLNTGNQIRKTKNMTQEQISQMYPVSRRTISDIVNHKTWRVQ